MPCQAMTEARTPAINMRSVWRAHAHAHPYAAWGLALSFCVIVALFAAGTLNAFGDADANHVRNGLLGGTAGMAATALGALAAILLRRLSTRAEDSMLGFAAGMMLAASCFSLLLPGLAAARDMTDSGALAAMVVVVGLLLGTLLMLGLDRFTPHEHAHGGPCGPGCERVSRVWLFVLAITLHNLPEGMAIGVSFAQGDMTVALPITAAIALQDVPEGLAVAFALRVAGMRPWHAILLAAASGAMEPLGALLGLALTTGFELAYPIGLGLAAGAMIFVVSHEVIPETHRNGHETHATLGLMVGFAVMMFLDTALGS